MARKKKRQKKPTPRQLKVEEPPVNDETTPATSLMNRVLQIGGDLVWSILVFSLVVLAKDQWIDHSIVGQHLRQTTYDISQLWLAARRDTKNVPVVVVDIGSLKPCPERLPDGKMSSPREELKQAITTVMNEGPAAVAIDIDFSPGTDIRCNPVSEHDQRSENDEGAFTDRGGPPLFQFALKQPHPLYLGVYRTQLEAPDRWLDSDDYRKLAATLTFPPEHSDEEEGTESNDDQIRRYMTRQIINEHEGYALNSLSFALSQHKAVKLSWLQRWVEQLRAAVLPLIETNEQDGRKIEKFLIDFSALRHMEQTTATYIDQKLVLRGSSLNGKLVLLGYTETAEAADKFIVPGDVRQVAGVYWHACGVDTLLRGVLARTTERGERLLDGLFYLPILLFIVALRIAYLKRPDIHIAEHRIESIGTKIAALLVFLLGTYFVSSTRIMWDGFLLVALISLLHPAIERYCRSAARWIWSRIKLNVRKVLFQDAK